MKHILNNLSEEEKNAIREQHEGGMKVMTENFSKLINSKLGDSKPLVNEQPIPAPTPKQTPGPNLAASGGGTTPQTKPKVNKTVNPKIDLDCNKKLIVNTQLPKLSKDANLAIINYFCQGTTSPQPGPGRPTPQPSQVRPSTTRPTAQPGPNLARQQRPNYPI